MERDLTENELIAVFMGDQFIPSTPLRVYLKYHKSWDWLMPVVEKIERLGYKIIISNTHGQYCNIMYDVNLAETSDTKAMGVGETKIEAVYKSVVEFIKWYNQNRKQ